MIGTILTIAVFVYIGMAVATAIFWSAALFVTGGFEEFAHRANVLVGSEMYTSNATQWLIVGTTLFWPVLLIALLTSTN